MVVSLQEKQYNHTATNLVIYSIKKLLNASCQKHTIFSYCHPGASLHAYFTETMKIIQKKNRGEGEAFCEKLNFIEKTYVVDTHWNCLYEAIPMCTNNILFFLVNTNHCLCLQLPISIKIAVTLPQVI